MTGPTPWMRRALVLFTRDLRLHDNPALDLACRQAAEVIPVFVFDPLLTLAAPGRVSFLLDCLTDLRAWLRQRGGDLLIRHGDPAAEVIRLARSHHVEGDHPGPRRVPLRPAAVSPAHRRLPAASARAARGRCAYRRPARRDRAFRWRPLPGVHTVLAALVHMLLATAAASAQARRGTRRLLISSSPGVSGRAGDHCGPWAAQGTTAGTSSRSTASGNRSLGWVRRRFSTAP